MLCQPAFKTERTGGKKQFSFFLSVFQTLVNWLKMFHLQLQKSETRMTPSILKQDPNTENIQKNTLLGQNTTWKLLW